MKQTLASYTKDLLRQYNFKPKLKLGQHFLTDEGVLKRILDVAQLSKDDLVIEIGTGLGILTRELSEKAGFVITIEYDKILFEIGKDLLKDLDNIEFIREDFLKIDIYKLLKKYKKFKSYKVVANLPYYITTPIISKLIKIKPELTVLTVQREVGDRIAAKPGTKEYGAFTVFVNYYTEPTIHSYVPKSAFYPQPEVSSAILVLKPYSKPPIKVKSKRLFFEIVRRAFGQRRKTLRNTLKKFKNIDEAFLKSGIDGGGRGETLSINEFARLSLFL